MAAEASEKIGLAQIAPSSSCCCPCGCRSSTHSRHSSSSSSSSSGREEDSREAYAAAVLAARERIFGPGAVASESDGAALKLSRKLRGREVADWYYMPPTEMPGFHQEERA